MGKQPLSRSRALVVTALLGVVSFAACGGTKTSGMGAGGADGLSGWTFLPTGSDSGGSSSSGGAGAGGMAGASGSAGSVAKGGAGGSVAVTLHPFACNAKVPNQPIITHFDGFMKDRWISGGNLDGGVYIYPEPLTLQDGDFLRYTDPVSTYAGVGMWFSGCIDASKFTGVRFTLSGSVPAMRNVTMYAISNRNRDIDEENAVGACPPADPNDTWASCRPPGLVVPVTTEPTIQEVPFTAFKNGLPSLTTDGSDLLALQWSFDWNDSLTSYPADLLIDNVEFYSAGTVPSGGSGGTGGAGGTGGSSGSGGVGGGGGTGTGGLAGTTSDGGFGGE